MSRAVIKVRYNVAKQKVVDWDTGKIALAPQKFFRGDQLEIWLWLEGDAEGHAIAESDVLSFKAKSKNELIKQDTGVVLFQAANTQFNNVWAGLWAGRNRSAGKLDFYCSTHTDNLKTFMLNRPNAEMVWCDVTATDADNTQWTLAQFRLECWPDVDYGGEGEALVLSGDDAEVTQDLSVGRNASIGGNLSVGGSLTLGSSLNLAAGFDLVCVDCGKTSHVYLGHDENGDHVLKHTPAV